MSEGTDLLTAGQVAERFQVAPQSVYRWAKQGVIPSVVVGGIRRFRVTDIDRLVLGDNGEPETAA